MTVTMTSNAVNEIKRVMKEKDISGDLNLLEINAISQGCSGVQYKLGFKNNTEIDQLNATLFNFDGLRAVISNQQLSFLNDTIIDYYQDEDKRGFSFVNEKMTGGSCSSGCGSGGCK